MPRTKHTAKNRNAIKSRADTSDAAAAKVADDVANDQLSQKFSSMQVSSEGRSVLSDKAILKHDVSLGTNFYRETKPEAGQGIFNIWSEEHVRRVWGQPQAAEPMSAWRARNHAEPLEGISDNDLIIWIGPGETILGHTVEFIGGRNSVTTMMKARSSLGRVGIELCKCAGWGDVGYVNRWTMEITNNSPNYHIPLVCGRRVAQIVFFETEGIVDACSYERSGKYQTSADVDQLKKTWHPMEMLPKLYKDKQALAAREEALNEQLQD